MQRSATHSMASTSASTTGAFQRPACRSGAPRLSARQRLERQPVQRDVSVCFMTGPSPAIATSTATTVVSSRPGPPPNTKQNLTVSWAGAGIYTMWELGAIKYLAQRFDMTKVKMVGASGGAIASVLAACGVSTDRAVEHAYAMSLQHNIWERPLALLGTWGGLIEQWLDDLLPADAHERCRGRVTVVVTTLPDCGQIGVSDFTSQKDLIHAVMASSHIPFALDLKLTRSYRGRQCVDGSFPDFFTGTNCELLRLGADRAAQAVVFDYFDDLALERKGRMDMLEVKSYEEILRMYRLGYEYAQRLHADGRFDHYELSELLLQGDHGHMSEVLVPEHSSSHQQQEHGAAVFASSSASSATGPQQQAASGSNSNNGRPPMGLVLELQQDERELVAELKGAQQQHAQQQQLQQQRQQQFSPA